jgi:hypothetical protein
MSDGWCSPRAASLGGRRLGLGYPAVADAAITLNMLKRQTTKKKKSLHVLVLKLYKNLTYTEISRNDVNHLPVSTALSAIRSVSKL